MELKLGFGKTNGWDIRLLKPDIQNLYNVVRKKQATVAEVLQTAPLNVSFRRALVGTKLTERHSLVASIMHVTLNSMLDRFVWGLHKNGSFSVNFMVSSLSAMV